MIHGSNFSSRCELPQAAAIAWGASIGGIQYGLATVPEPKVPEPKVIDARFGSQAIRIHFDSPRAAAELPPNFKLAFSDLRDRLKRAGIPMLDAVGVEDEIQARRGSRA